jgi:hypothetical protein
MNRTKDLSKVAAKYVTPIEEAELTIRLIEAIGGIRRPPGQSVAAVLAALPDDTRNDYRRGARAAVEYFRECIAAANTVS